MLAAVLLTENRAFSLIEQVETAAIMLSVLLVTLLLILVAGWVHRFIGQSGASIISRVMGLVLSSVAVTNVLVGIKQFLNCEAEVRAKMTIWKSNV